MCLLVSQTTFSADWRNDFPQTTELPGVVETFSMKHHGDLFRNAVTCHVGTLTKEAAGNATHGKDGVFFWVELPADTGTLSSMQFYNVLRDVDGRVRETDLVRIALSVRSDDGRIKLLDWDKTDYFSVHCGNVPFSALPDSILKEVLLLKYPRLNN